LTHTFGSTYKPVRLYEQKRVRVVQLALFHTCVLLLMFPFFILYNKKASEGGTGAAAAAAAGST